MGTLVKISEKPSNYKYLTPERKCEEIQFFVLATGNCKYLTGTFGLQLGTSNASNEQIALPRCTTEKRGQILVCEAESV